MSKLISSPITPKLPVTAFTADQWEALSRLRTWYPKYAEYFSAQELAHLRFVRWLHRTGRLHA